MTGIAILLAVSVIGLAGFTAKGMGYRLFFALLLLEFGVACVNPMIEAIVFQVMPLNSLPAQIAMQLLFAIVVCGLVTLVRGKANTEYLKIPPGFLVRLIGAGACYTVLYLIAGTLVFPFVKDFYANKVLPGLGILAPLQVIRGALYVLFALAWLRLRPKQAGIVLGLFYAVIGGIAPLLIDNNPYMPANIRHAHMVEVGVENFLFGLIAAQVLKTRKAALRTESVLS